MMETIREDEVEDFGPPPPDPDLPPLFYAESPGRPKVYTRAFNHPESFYPPFWTPLTLEMKDNLAYDPFAYSGKTQKGPVAPVFFFSASKPLPAEFHISINDRPDCFFVCLTHDESLVNISDFTRPPRCRPAAQRVLGSPELLENIFCNLDMVTLLTSIQRVNKTFKDVVDTSHSLQKKLYFKPDEKAEKGPHGQAKWWKDEGKQFPVHNPLLVKYFGPCFFNFGDVYGYFRRARSFYQMDWTRHHDNLKSVKTIWPGESIIELRRPELSGMDPVEAITDRERFTRAGASWRRMLVCQPPIHSLGALVFQPVEPPKPTPQQMEKILIKPETDRGGIRMGQLYDLVREQVALRRFDTVWFRVTWFEPFGEFISNLCKDSVHEMMNDNVPVVVEMFHKKDHFEPYNRADPPNSAVFNAIFQSKESETRSWVPYEVVVDHNDTARYARASPDTHWRLPNIW